MIGLSIQDPSIESRIQQLEEINEIILHEEELNESSKKSLKDLLQNLSKGK